MGFIAKSIPILLLALLTGCGTIKNTVQVNSVPQNAPVRNLLSVDYNGSSSKFDAMPTRNSIYEDMNVFTASGKRIHLDPLKQPILFEAFWCPHCQRTMVLLEKHWSELGEHPIFLSAGFLPGTILTQAKQISSKEFNMLGVHNVTVYYLLGPAPISTFPTLVFRSGTDLKTLAGEHTLQVWEKALK